MSKLTMLFDNVINDELLDSIKKSSKVTSPGED